MPTPSSNNHLIEDAPHYPVPGEGECGRCPQDKMAPWRPGKLAEIISVVFDKYNPGPPIVQNREKVHYWGWRPVLVPIPLEVVDGRLVLGTIMAFQCCFCGVVMNYRGFDYTRVASLVPDLQPPYRTKRLVPCTYVPPERAGFSRN